MRVQILENELEVPVCKNVAEGLQHGVTSTGRQLGVVTTADHGLWRIRYIDGKPGNLPERLQGRYTGVKFAQFDLDTFVEETWRIAAEKTPKRTKVVEQTVAA